MEKSERIAETARVLKWTQKYGGWWYLICTPEEEHMTIETMNRVERVDKIDTQKQKHA